MTVQMAARGVSFPQFVVEANCLAASVECGNRLSNVTDYRTAHLMAYCCFPLCIMHVCICVLVLAALSVSSALH